VAENEDRCPVCQIVLPNDAVACFWLRFETVSKQPCRCSAFTRFNDTRHPTHRLGTRMG